MKDLVLASSNKHKLEEVRKILEPLGYFIHFANEYVDDFNPVENGKTFIDNSYIKAKALYDAIKIPVIADDSGLSIDLFNGEPGINSHRYSETGLDQDNRLKVIENLHKLNKTSSKAHFTSAITYIDSERTINVEGYLDGIVIDKELGENGFGYDSMFYLEEYNKTVAELDPETKNKISHRYNALMKLREELLK